MSRSSLDGGEEVEKAQPVEVQKGMKEKYRECHTSKLMTREWWKDGAGLEGNRKSLKDFNRE